MIRRETRRGGQVTGPPAEARKRGAAAAARVWRGRLRPRAIPCRACGRRPAMFGNGGRCPTCSGLDEVLRALLALAGLLGWGLALFLLAGCRGEATPWP